MLLLLLIFIIAISIIVFFTFKKTSNKKNYFKKVVDSFNQIDNIALDNIDFSYSEVSIPKKNWWTRKINIPNDNLKSKQKEYLKFLQKIIFPKFITGFRKCHPINVTARKHIGQNVVVNLDIDNFFDNITVEKIRSRLEDTLIKEKKIKPVAKLDKERPWLKTQTPVDNLLQEKNAHIEKIISLITYNGCLPQGAPTSPFMSNFVFLPIDYYILNTLKRYDPDVIYTRYADNITFSSSKKWSNILNAIRIIDQGILSKYWYKINKQKTSISRKHTRQTVLGLVVNEKLSYPRKKYMILRAKINNFLAKWEWNISKIKWYLSFLYLVDTKKYKTLKKYYSKKYWEIKTNKIFVISWKKKKNRS